MMKHKLALGLLCACLLSLGCGSQAFADVAPDPRTGGVSVGTAGKSDTTIVMTEEQVTLNVSLEQCKTSANFVLQNTGPAVELEAGFPADTPLHQYDLNDFAVTVDGKPVTTRDTMVEDKVEKGACAGSTARFRWKVWNMKFDANQSRKVEVKYSNPGITTTSRAQELSLTSFYAASQTEIEDKLRQMVVEYTLVTGSYWFKPIGKCHVEMILENGITKDNVVNSFPAPTATEETKLIWDWENFEPQNNIAVRLNTGMKESEYMTYLRGLRDKNPTDAAITLLLARKTVADWKATKGKTMPKTPDYYKEETLTKLGVFELYFKANKDRLAHLQAKSNSNDIVDMASEALRDYDKFALVASAKQMVPIFMPLFQAQLKKYEGETSGYGFYQAERFKELLQLCTKYGGKLPAATPPKKKK